MIDETSSYATSLNTQNALSTIIQETGMGLFAWSNLSAVEPPMLRPQKAIFDVLPFD